MRDMSAFSRKPVAQPLELRDPAGPAGPGAIGRFQASTESVILVASLFWSLAANRSFFNASLHIDGAGGFDWALAFDLMLIVTALHVLVLGLVCTRRTLKPVLVLLAVVAATSMHFMQTFGIVLDPSMLRNAWQTNLDEARELLSWRLALDLLLYAGLPIALLMGLCTPPRPLRTALAARAVLMGSALLIGVGALVWQYKPLAALMRNHKELRYLVTPANALWSFGAVLAADVRGAAQPRQPIGLDATPGPSWAAQSRPRLVVVVVGETVRAANWGLNGYARPTTPRLAGLPVVNFTQASACGSSTAVSLPCMFAPVGRRDYDEARIRGSQSLLHVLARAGVSVLWRDNQAGCKGVCDGLPTEQVSAANAPGLCKGDACFDEGLLNGLEPRLAEAAAGHGNQLLVLHMLGNHGPAYFRRYPPAFERFRPACREDDLGRCSQAEIVNAYDNAVLYTDHVLATLIGTLQAQSDKVDAAVVYLSDHGESLGEKGLYLHGLPMAIAPSEQTHIPMLMWWSDGFAQQAGLDLDCMQRRHALPTQHDHLFHTVLGLLDVQTALYAAGFDLTAGCRRDVRVAQ